MEQVANKFKNASDLMEYKQAEYKEICEDIKSAFWRIVFHRKKGRKV